MKELKKDRVSLNIKVTPSLDDELKKTRARARDVGLKFNVSEEVIGFLEKRLKTANKELDEREKAIRGNNQVKSAVEEEFGDHPAIRGTGNY